MSEKKILKYIFHGEKLNKIGFQAVFILFSALVLLFSASCAHKTHRISKINFSEEPKCQITPRPVELKKKKSRLHASILLPSLDYDIGLKIRGNIFKGSERVNEVPVNIIAETAYEPRISEVKIEKRKEQWIEKSVFASKKIQIELSEEYKCTDCEIVLVFQKQVGLDKQKTKINTVFSEQLEAIDECFKKQVSAVFGNTRWRNCSVNKVPRFDAIQRDLKDKYRTCGKGEELYPLIEQRKKVIQELNTYGAALWKGNQLNYVDPKPFNDVLSASKTISTPDIDSFFTKYGRSLSYAQRQHDLVRQSVKIACEDDSSCLQNTKKNKKVQELFAWSKILLIESETRYRSNHVSKKLPTMSHLFGSAKKAKYENLNQFIDYLGVLKSITRDIQSGEEAIAIPLMDAELVRVWSPTEDYSSSLEQYCPLTMMPSTYKSSLISYTNDLIQKDEQQCCTNLEHLTKDEQESILDGLQPYLCSGQKKKMCTPCYGSIGRKKWKQDRFEGDEVYKRQVRSEVRKELRKDEEESIKLFEKCEVPEGEKPSLATLKECLQEHNETYIGCEKENREEIIKIAKEFNELSSNLDVRLVLDSQNALEPYVKEFGVAKVGKVVQSAFGFESDTYGIEDPDGLSCFPVTKVRDSVISSWGISCGSIGAKCKEVNELMEKETKGLKISKCVIQQDSYPSSNSISWALPKQKERWKILDRSFRCSQNRCINVTLEKKHFGGGEGVWIASTNSFKVNEKKPSKKNSLGYWKKSKPVYVWNTSLNGRDSVTVRLCPAKSNQAFYLQLTPR